MPLTFDTIWWVRKTDALVLLHLGLPNQKLFTTRSPVPDPPDPFLTHTSRIVAAAVRIKTGLAADPSSLRWQLSRQLEETDGSTALNWYQVAECRRHQFFIAEWKRALPIMAAARLVSHLEWKSGVLLQSEATADSSCSHFYSGKYPKWIFQPRLSHLVGVLWYDSCKAMIRL